MHNGGKKPEEGNRRAIDPSGSFEPSNECESGYKHKQDAANVGNAGESTRHRDEQSTAKTCCRSNGGDQTVQCVRRPRHLSARPAARIERVWIDHFQSDTLFIAGRTGPERLILTYYRWRTGDNRSLAATGKPTNRGPVIACLIIAAAVVIAAAPPPERWAISCRFGRSMVR